MSEAIGTETRWTVLVQLTALPAWLALPRDRRREIGARCTAVAGRWPRIRLRWLDVEAFTGECSDVLIAETPDPREWNHLFEALRDTELFAVPYFRLERILTGIENGYVEYEAAVRVRP
jgi:hypothetical protein